MTRDFLNPALPATHRRLAWTTGALAATVAGVLLVSGPASAGSAAGGGRPVAFEPIVNADTGQCLTVRAGDGYSLSGARVQQDHCTGRPEQQWRLVPVDPPGAATAYEVVSRRSGLCLAPASSAAAGGTPAIQVACTGGASVLWSVISHGHGYALQNVADHEFLTGSGPGAPGQVRLRAADGTAGQVWQGGLFAAAAR